MALRLRPLTDDAWRRLAAVRRVYDLDGTPSRSEINAIELELRDLRVAEPPDLVRPAG